jgi:hypothetical protein
MSLLTLLLSLTALLRPLSAHNGAVAIAVPVEGIVVDGDLSDWPGEMDWYQISVHDEDSLRESESDLQGEFRAGYNREENAMYFDVEITAEAGIRGCTDQGSHPSR